MLDCFCKYINENTDITLFCEVKRAQGLRLQSKQMEKNVEAKAVCSHPTMSQNKE